MFSFMLWASIFYCICPKVVLYHISRWTLRTFRMKCIVISKVENLINQLILYDNVKEMVNVLGCVA